MTFKQFAEERLKGWHLWPDWIADILPMCEVRPGLTDVWDKEIDEYPNVMKAAVNLTADNQAVAYLEKNHPQCFQLLAILQCNDTI